MKTSLFPVSDLRFFLGREADCRRLVRPAGAFGKKNKFPGGANRWGDTSTRAVIARILTSGEKPLKDALAVLKGRPSYEGAMPAPILPSNWGTCPSQFVGSMCQPLTWSGALAPQAG